jgi:hypothetical protein
MSAVLPFTVDYAGSRIDVAPLVTLSMDGNPIGSANVTSDGQVAGLVPSGLTPGVYDVTALLQDGRTATLDSGFTVTPGIWPSGYTIDPIPSELLHQPFDVTVRAQGTGSQLFDGTVRLATDTNTVSPSLSDPFIGGVLIQQVILSGHRATMTLTVTDARGISASSNPFSAAP